MNIKVDRQIKNKIISKPKYMIHKTCGHIILVNSTLQAMVIYVPSKTITSPVGTVYQSVDLDHFEDFFGTIEINI